MATEERQPLLNSKNQSTNKPLKAQYSSINNNDEYVIIIDQEKNNNATDELVTINGTEYWEKITVISNEDIVVELSTIDYTNNQIITYKNQYTNYGSYNKNNLKLETFQKQERKLTPEFKFMENITIDAIKEIDALINNTNVLNEQIKLFKGKPNNNELNTLLTIYKYLTVIQNFIDKAKTNETSNFKNLFKKIGNLTLGILEIYIGLTGKNLQRVISNYPIDGKNHTFEDYTNAIFWNPANYMMVLIDTALGTFCTAAASSWARDVFFNKKIKTNPYQINEFSAGAFQEYKKNLQLFLFEQNQELSISNFSKMAAIKDLAKTINQAANTNETNFQYHSQFIKEVNEIKKIKEEIASEANNDNDREVKQLVATTNKTIKTLAPKKDKLPALAKNWGRNCLVNFALETATWASSHIILTGSSENTSKDNFNLQDWITKDIFSIGALAANISRYFVMRPINNIFKSGLTNLGIPTNLTPEILARWIDRQPQYKKVLMAIPLFMAVTFIVNAVKTEAALVTEYGFDKAQSLFYEKFFRWTTLGFSIGVTAVDMATFAMSDFYQETNLVPQLKSWIKKTTNYCQLTKTKEESWNDKTIKTVLVELEKKGELSTFNEMLKNSSFNNKASITKNI